LVTVRFRHLGWVLLVGCVFTSRPVLPLQDASDPTMGAEGGLPPSDAFAADAGRELSTPEDRAPPPEDAPSRSDSPTGTVDSDAQPATDAGQSPDGGLGPDPCDDDRDGGARRDAGDARTDSATPRCDAGPGDGAAVDGGAAGGDATDADAAGDAVGGDGVGGADAEPRDGVAGAG
jgi:hypothetical protein